MDSASWAQEEDAPEITSNITSNINRRQSQNGLSTEKISDAFRSDEEEDEGDDDGFLESWFEAENAKKGSAVSAKEAVAKTINVSAENVIIFSVQKATELQLGCSVLNWISGRKTRHSQSIRMKFMMKVVVVLLAWLLLSEIALAKMIQLCKDPPRYCGSLIIQGNSRGWAHLKLMKYIGQATFPNETEGATSTSERTMVDCLAVYDRNKKCYILEMEDFAVTNLNLTPQSSENEEVMHVVVSKRRDVKSAKVA